MTMRQFISENKAELSEAINRVLDNDPSSKVTSAECENWIMNDESLYNWAKASGVRV